MPAGLFETLKTGAVDDWRAYVEHEFVAGLANGRLPEAAFRYYLAQDYLFLIHFARAYALAVYKADNMADMRQAAAGMSAILDLEMGLHIDYCRGWGFTEEQMAAVPEDPRCVAYTRYVLERGMAGDLLDLHVALAPCIVGYGEIGRRLAEDPETLKNGNPYGEWIAMYAGQEYRDVMAAELATLDSLMERRGGPGRMGSLQEIFRTATRLEADFWQMGLDAAG